MTELHAHLTANATVTAIGRSRTNLALHHLFAACRFSARVGEIENQNSGQPFGAFWEEILQNSLGVATLTVAALESYANEMYFQGAILRPGLTPAAAEEIAELIDRESVIRKYAIALSIAAGKRLDMGSTSMQNADALIKMRNAVVHFRPEWFDESGKHEKISKLLQSRFEPSQFFPNEPVFPRAWASHSFTILALRSSVEFIDNFHSEVGRPSPIEPFRAQISALSSNTL